MTWEIVLPRANDADLARLDPGDLTAVYEALFAWVESGPPPGSTTIRHDEVAPGLVVTYVVHEEQRYVAVLRVRRRGPPP